MGNPLETTAWSWAPRTMWRRRRWTTTTTKTKMAIGRTREGGCQVEEIISGTKTQKNDTAIKNIPYFLRKYKVRFGLASGLHFQSGLTLLKLFTLGRLIWLIKGEKLICSNYVKTVKHLPPANLGQSTPDFQIDNPSVTKGSFFPIDPLCLSGLLPSTT